MEDLRSFKNCSFCNLFSGIQCMMQELKADHVRKSHSPDKSNKDCPQTLQKQNEENQKNSLNMAETTTVAEVSLKTERIKERSDGYFKDDTADGNYDIAVSTMKDYNEDPIGNKDTVLDNNYDNSNFTIETNNDNSYNFDEFISNGNETTMNVEDKNDSTDSDQDNLKNVSDTDTDEKEDLEIRLSNESKIWNHFLIKKDTNVEDVCIYCGKVLKRKAGKSGRTSFLNHLRYKHQDKLPVERHRSIAWNHFNPVPSNNKKAECKYCGKWMSTIYGSTSSLIRHLIIKHQLVNIESLEKVKPTPVASEYSKDDSINIDGVSSSSSAKAEEGLMDDMLIDKKRTFNNHIESVDQGSIADGEDNNFGNEYHEFSATTKITKHHGSMDTFFENDTENEVDIFTESKYNYNKAPVNYDDNVIMNDNDANTSLTVLDKKESLQSSDDLTIQGDVWNHFQIKPNSNDEAECNYCDKVLNFCDDMTGSLMYHLKHKHPRNGKKVIGTRAKKSLVWNHCTQQPNSEKIQCNYCNIIYLSSNGSTSNMKRHLENKHPQKLCGKGSNESLLLDNFKPQLDAKRKTECKYCGVWISNSDGNTTRMLKHVRTTHEELMKSRTNERKINDKKSYRSLVWDFFNRPEKGDSVMKCSYCGELYSNPDPDGNKSDMIKHLEVKHPSKIQAFAKETEEKFTSKENFKFYDTIERKGVNRTANSIWEHFIFEDNKKDQVHCKYCDTSEKPSTMISHLRKNHPNVMKIFTDINKPEQVRQE